MSCIGKTIWTLEGEQQECSGAEVGGGSFSDVNDCAEACKGKSSMFAFGTNDFGTTRCYSGNNKGCSCLCETSATNGNCKVVSHSGYRLYRYGKYQVFRR